MTHWHSLQSTTITQDVNTMLTEEEPRAILALQQKKQKQFQKSKNSKTPSVL